MLSANLITIIPPILAEGKNLSAIAYIVFLVIVVLIMWITLSKLFPGRNQDVDTSLQQNERIIELLEEINRKLDRP